LTPVPSRCRTAGAAIGVAVALFALAPLAHAAGPEGGLDGRQWERVSPLEKNGGEVAAPAGPEGGAFQAAVQGDAFAFASTASFGAAAGAAPLSQYVARRTAGGWVTENVTPPLLSGTYDADPYLLFSADLSGAILTGGWRCRDGGAECPQENPPLGPGGPPGYRNLYLHDLAAGSYTPLVTTANAPALALPAEDFHLTLYSADPDLSHVVISTCAALSAGSSEVPGPEGCDPGSPNFYEWSAGGTLVQLDLAPPAGTIPPVPTGFTADGSRHFFTTAEALVSTDTNHADDVYEWQRQGAGGCAKVAGCTGLVSSGRSGSATFLDVSADGTDVFFRTDASLLPGDPGGFDVYDARAGGGFPEPPAPIACLGDACQGPAPAPEDLAPATALVISPGNPHPPKVKKPRCSKRRVKRGRCARKHRHRDHGGHFHAHRGRR
jgi:hypothetical protein